jgi:ribonuclease VapC
LSEEIHILDSSAILCVIFQEPGHETVESKLNGALVSAVNLSEVVSKLQEQGMPDEIIDAVLTRFKLTIVGFNEIAARSAGLLRNATRSRGLSVGDRACLALAMQHNAIAVTADRAWQDLACGARVLLVR